MVAMAEKDAALEVAHLSPEIQATRRSVPAAVPLDSEFGIRMDLSLPKAVELVEKTMVKAALDRSKGRLEEAAKLLGISRTGLFLKRRRWGMEAGSAAVASSMRQATTASCWISACQDCPCCAPPTDPDGLAVALNRLVIDRGAAARHARGVFASAALILAALAAAGA
ncbi:MAG: hypothetical protein M3541_15940 [Acidobacteriota bacterium]|nr:hypothetical protein [Acidobacteriota bacterium]MDQ3420238.1 hypothetical protein [Acidobacteriota bacterium]